MYCSVAQHSNVIQYINIYTVYRYQFFNIQYEATKRKTDVICTMRDTIGYSKFMSFIY